MAAIKTWAKSLFVLAVFSSTVLLVTPKSMLKQARFVTELLLLLCVVAPLAGLLNSANAAAALPQVWSVEGPDRFSFEKFYAEETAKRVIEIGLRVGVPVDSVKVTTKDSGFSLAGITVYLKDRPAGDALAVFRDSLGSYLGVPSDKVEVVLP